MKIVNSYIFRAVCALLIGLLLVSNPERMTGLLVQVIGGLFLISGLVSLINYFIIRYSDKVPVKPVFPLVGLGSLLFGVFLGFFPGAVHYLSDVYFRFPDGGGRCQPVVEYVPFTPFDTFPLVCLVFHFVDYGSGSVRAFQSVGVRFRPVHSFGDKFHALRCVGIGKRCALA